MAGPLRALAVGPPVVPRVHPAIVPGVDPAIVPGVGPAIVPGIGPAVSAGPGVGRCAAKNYCAERGRGDGGEGEFAVSDHAWAPWVRPVNPCLFPVVPEI